jgi:hypothetical protein
MNYTQVDDGVLEKDIIEIINSEYMSPEAIDYECIIHTRDVDVYIDNLISVETMCDYVNNIGDYVLVNFLYPMGDYIYDILPHNDNLEITLKYKYYNKSVTNRYKAVILNYKGNGNNTPYENQPRDTLNKLEGAVVEVQLLDRVVEILRTEYCEGIYDYTTVGSVIKGTINNALQDIKVDGQVLPVAVNVVEPDNTKIYRHINIPFGVNILDLPGYLHDKDYGVYNTGIGTYFKNIYKSLTDVDPLDCLFVYNIYDNLRFDDDEHKLIILSSNGQKFRYVEHSYIKDGDVIKILASNTKNMDDGEIDLINKGNAIISSNPNSIISGNKFVTDEMVLNDKDYYLTGRATHDKRDGVKKATYVENTDNLFKHRSEVIVRQRKLYQFEWKNSNDDLLFPGMSVGYVYQSKTYGVIKLRGILQSSYTLYDKSTKRNNTLLNVMLESPMSYEFQTKNDGVIKLS